MQSTLVAVLITLWGVSYSQAWALPNDLYLEENDVCQDDGYQVWRCRKARECAATAELIRSGEIFTCSLANPRNPLVCCPPPDSDRIIKRQSISQQKCREYKEALCNQNFDTIEPNKRLVGRPPSTLLERALPVTDTTDELEDWLTEVGEETQDQGTTKTPPRVSVVGGEAAWAGEHPHMALVGFGPEVRISWLCGGSLISERFVLSAAHCAEPKGLGKARWVLLGATDIRDKDGPESTMRQQFQITEQYVHEDYQSSLVYNDIVLFRLDRDVKFTWFVAPACLYPGLTNPNGKAVVTGWGRNESNGPRIPILQKAILSFLPPETCKKRVGVNKEMFPEGIHTPSQLCAWERGKDTCGSDSGGPLVKAEKDSCLAQQVGITSFGHVLCGETETPGTYVRVAYFLPWIESIVWPSAR